MAKSSVLIVDGDGELAKIIAAFLNLQGYRVNYVTRIRDAVSKLALQKYTAILLDPKLPNGERGEEVIRAAGDPGGMNSVTPFILMCKDTAYRLPNDSVRHVRGIVGKPFQFEDLLGSLQGPLQARS